MEPVPNRAPSQWSGISDATLMDAYHATANSLGGWNMTPEKRERAKARLTEISAEMESRNSQKKGK